MRGAYRVAVEQQPVRLGYLSSHRARGAQAAQPDRDRAAKPGVGGRAHVVGPVRPRAGPRPARLRASAPRRGPAGPVPGSAARRPRPPWRPPRRGTPRPRARPAGPAITPSRISEQSRFAGDGPTLIRISVLSATASSQRLVRSSTLACSPRRQIANVVMSCSSQNAMPGSRYRSASANSRLPRVDSAQVGVGARRLADGGPRPARCRARGASGRPSPGPWPSGWRPGC